MSGNEPGGAPSGVRAERPASLDPESERLRALEEVRDKAENALAAASLPVPPATHVEGLTGMMRDVLDIARRALSTESEPR